MARPPIYQIDGEKVPSVTTITGRYGESGGLTWWANAIGLGTHESCDGQPICKKCGKRPGLTLNEGKRPAADTGKYGHALIEEAIKGTPFDERDFEHLTAEQREQGNGCLDSYKRWAASFKVQYIGTELSLISKVHRFGGTLDAAGYVGDRFALIDWKTSNGIYPNYLSQLAAYLILLEENEFPEVELIDILRFSKSNASFEHRSWSRKSFAPALEHFIRSRLLYDMEAPLKKLMK